jgi:DNA-binding NarL/FixJ family response regulator
MNSQFTPLERQVIAYLLQGKSNKEIALALGLSVRAVEFHLGNTYTRLAVSAWTDLPNRSIFLGLVNLEICQAIPLPAVKGEPRQWLNP